MEKLNALSAKLRQLELDFTLHRRNLDDLEEKHSRRLNSLRAQLQQRKAGKWGPEDGAQSSNGREVGGTSTPLSHREIEAVAREKGYI